MRKILILIGWLGLAVMSNAMQLNFSNDTVLASNPVISGAVATKGYVDANSGGSTNAVTNLVQGSNVTLTKNDSHNWTIAASGGGSGGDVYQANTNHFTSVSNTFDKTVYASNLTAQIVQLGNPNKGGIALWVNTNAANSGATNGYPLIVSADSNIRLDSVAYDGNYRSCFPYTNVGWYNIGFFEGNFGSMDLGGYENFGSGFHNGNLARVSINGTLFGHANFDSALYMTSCFASGDFNFDRLCFGANVDMAIGSHNFYYNLYGDNCAAIGYWNYYNLLFGYDDTAIGEYAFPVMTNGSRNVAFSTNAGQGVIAGDDNVFMQANSGSTTAFVSRVFVAGVNAMAGGNDQIVLGTNGAPVYLGGYFYGQAPVTIVGKGIYSNLLSANSNAVAGDTIQIRGSNTLASSLVPVSGVYYVGVGNALLQGINGAQVAMAHDGNSAYYFSHMTIAGSNDTALITRAGGAGYQLECFTMDDCTVTNAGLGYALQTGANTSGTYVYLNGCTIYGQMQGGYQRYLYVYDQGDSVWQGAGGNYVYTNFTGTAYADMLGRIPAPVNTNTLQAQITTNTAALAALQNPIIYTNAPGSAATINSANGIRQYWAPGQYATATVGTVSQTLTLDIVTTYPLIWTNGTLDSTAYQTNTAAGTRWYIDPRPDGSKAIHSLNSI